MGMLEELGARLAGSTAGLVLGKSLFLHALPDDTTGVAVGLFETGGITPQSNYGAGKPVWENARVQILVRSTGASGGPGIASPVNARAKIKQVWENLTTIQNTSVGSTTVGKSFYYRVTAVQSPFFLQRDGQGASVFACNFDVQRAP